MEDITGVFGHFTALDASLYGVAVTLAILVRFFRAYWHGFGDRATLLAAVLFGGGGSWLASTESMDPPRSVFWIGTQAVSLMVSVLVAELLSRKIPGLPADNALAGQDNPNPKP